MQCLRRYRSVWCFSSVSGATSGLSLGSKSGGWLWKHLGQAVFGGTPHTIVFPFSVEHSCAMNFDHFSCLFVWSVSSRASDATAAAKKQIRRPRDVVCIVNCEIFRLGPGVLRSDSVFRARPSSRIVQHHHSFVLVWLRKGILQGVPELS